MAAEINLFVLGDQGVKDVVEGHVAAAMDLYRRSQLHGGDGITEIPLDAVLLLGDNFEGKPYAVEYHEQFADVFQNFDAPFYITLGNHDVIPDAENNHNPDPQAQWTKGRPPNVPATGPRWTTGSDWPLRHYRVDLPSKDEPLVTLIELDSNYGNHGLQAASGEAFLAAALAEIAQKNKNQWVIVFTHYPLYTNGCHREGTGEFPTLWKPLLQQGVQFYLSGHNHNLEHLEVDDPAGPAGQKLKTSFILSGSGGQVYKLRSHDRGPFARRLAGFVHLRLLPDQAEVKFIGFHKEDSPATAQVVHSFIRNHATGTIAYQQLPPGPDGTVPQPLVGSDVGDSDEMWGACREH